MSDPIIEAAIADRVRMCVAAGSCVCPEDMKDPNCPCHSVGAIALSEPERKAAPAIIDEVRAEEGNNVV